MTVASRRAYAVCSVPGCPEYTDRGRCDDHRRQAEQRRGSARQRGYGGQDWERARADVLTRDPVCVLCHTEPSRVADHWPTSRRELLQQGVPDPDAPARMRGVCRPCHSTATATSPDQAGGWNR
jgi:5-methylcytosine-specific restriction protein A